VRLYLILIILFVSPGAALGAEAVDAPEFCDEFAFAWMSRMHEVRSALTRVAALYQGGNDRAIQFGVA